MQDILYQNIIIPIKTKKDLKIIVDLTNLHKLLIYNMRLHVSNQYYYKFILIFILVSIIILRNYTQLIKAIVVALLNFNDCTTS